MSEHTPGRLEVAVQVFDNDGYPETVVHGMGGSAAVAVCLDFGPNNPRMRGANARHLVACWNACDGFETDLLENIVMTGGTLKSRFALRTQEERELKAERDSLRAVNAELLEALEACMRGCEYRSIGGHEPAWHQKQMPSTAALNKARAAIASARKQGEQG